MVGRFQICRKKCSWSEFLTNVRSRPSVKPWLAQISWGPRRPQRPGLLRLITSALVSKGCMQSFDLLALKLRPWCGDIVMDRHSFWVFLYIVRFFFQISLVWKVFECRIFFRDFFAGILRYGLASVASDASGVGGSSEASKIASQSSKIASKSSDRRRPRWEPKIFFKPKKIWKNLENIYIFFSISRIFFGLKNFRHQNFFAGILRYGNIKIKPL